MNFPNSPTLNQSYSSDGRTWKWDGTKWLLDASLATSSVVTYGISSEVASGGVNLRLTGSDASTDDVKFAAGSNISLARTDANTITVSASSASYDVGTVVSSYNTPTGGTWLESGKYYSKSTYPALASVLGDIPDIGEVPKTTKISGGSNLWQSLFIDNTAIRCYATNGSVTIMASGSSSGVLITSDGINWKSVPYFGLQSQSIRDVRYLNGNFIITTSSASAYSSDGYNWQVTPAATVSVAYGNGTYISNGGSSLLQKSTDLINFTRQLADSTQAVSSYNKILYENNTFFAMSSVAGKNVYSTNGGVSWSITGPALALTDVVYGNGVWVALNVVSITATVYWSSDLITWNTVASFPINVHSGSRIRFLNGVFYIGGYAGKMAYSTNGSTWTSVQVLSNGNFNGFNIYDIVWDGTTYVAGSQLGHYATSTNGTTWTQKRHASQIEFYNLAVSHNNIISAYYFTFSSGAFNDTQLIGGPVYSWITQGAATQFGSNAIAYNGTNTYILATTNAILRSSDGVNWTACSSNVLSIQNPAYARVKYVNNIFFVYGYEGGLSGADWLVYSSDNGVTWTNTTNVFTYSVTDITYGGGFYVVTGQGGNLYYSTNLISWTSVATGASRLYDVIWNGTAFIAGAFNNYIVKITPGTPWTSTTISLPSLTYTSGLFQANNVWFTWNPSNGASVIFYTSTDGGNTWTLRNMGVSATVNSIAWNGSVFCIVCSNGKIFTTADGATYQERSLLRTAPTLGWVRNIGTTFIVANYITSSIYISTDNGVTWKIYGGPVGNSQCTMFHSVGNKVFGYWQGTTAISNNGIDWTISNSSNNMTVSGGGENRMWKLNNKYFYPSQFRMYYSNDGVTWNFANTFPAANSLSSFVRFAYNGSIWLAVIRTQNSEYPIVIMKSIDGITWTQLHNPVTDLLLNATVNISTMTVNLTAANGEFLLSLGAQNFTINQFNFLYASTDGVTWTARTVPIGLPIGDFDSNGTTVVASIIGSSGNFNSNAVFKTTNNGVSWQGVSLGNMGSFLVAPRVDYISNGTWIIGKFKSTDLVNWTIFSKEANTSFAAAGDYIIGITSDSNLGYNTTPVLHSKNSMNSLVDLVIPGSGGVVKTYSPTSKELFVNANNDILMAIYGQSAGINNNNFIELPLYSYNTTTTFWIPPTYTNGKKDYIYAGA